MQLDGLPLADAGALFARAAAALYPPERIDVHQAALRHRVLTNRGGGLTGIWTDEAAPYLVRPMLALTDPIYSMVAVMGPGQSGKSEIGNNWILWSVIADPADMVWLAPDKFILGSYVREKVNPMIRSSAALRARLANSRSSDNVFAKSFEGCEVSFIWPVAAQLRMRSVPRFVVDDFDAVPEDIQGEGDPLTLLGTRQTTFEGREKGYVASSPALGSYKGIEALVARGTDERWHWRCVHCADYFAPEFERDFYFKRDGSAAEASDTAHVACPLCGGVIEQSTKLDMQAHGRWAGPGQRIDGDGTVTGPARQTSIASFRIDGLIGFASWSKLAHDWRVAEIEWETRQSEEKLRAFINTRAGKNYTSRDSAAKPVSAEELAARVEPWKLGVVPLGVRFLVASVDVQGNRFEVMVIGVGENSETWIIDRYAIRVLDDGRTDIQPARNGAHWEMLFSRVLRAVYPLEDRPDMVLPIANTVIDSGGMPGATEQAMAFVRRALARGIPEWSVTLIKGAAFRDAPELGRPKPEYDDDGKKRDDGVPLFLIGVHRLKDVIDTRLRLDQPGAGYIHLPTGLKDQHFAEMRGETREGGVWVKQGPNETWDLLVYCEAARLRMRDDRPEIDWSNPPMWARPRARVEGLPALVAPARTSSAPQGRRVISRGIRH